VEEQEENQPGQERHVVELDTDNEMEGIVGFTVTEDEFRYETEAGVWVVEEDDSKIEHSGA
jgi:hypothetical protein